MKCRVSLKVLVVRKLQTNAHTCTILDQLTHTHTHTHTPFVV